MTPDELKSLPKGTFIVMKTGFHLAEFCEPSKRHIVSVFKIIQELLAPAGKKGKNQFQQLMQLLPDDHKVVDRHGVIHHGRVRRLVPQECFRLMGFEDSQFFKLQNELHLSDAKLYKLAGNSIIVPILADIMTNIKQVNAKYGIVKER